MGIFPTRRVGQAGEGARWPAARALARPRLSATTLIVGTLVLIGLAMRLWFVAVNDIDPRFSAADDGDYYQRALHLAVTGQYVDNSWLIRPPGHVFMFAGLLRIGIALGDPTVGIALIRGVHIALSLLLIPLGYDLARRLFDRRAGLIFAAILAVWFPFVELPVLILSEPLFISMLGVHFWLLVRWRDSYRSRGRSWPWLLAAGVTLAVASLARSPALYASAFVALFVAVEVWRRMADDRRPMADGFVPTRDIRQFVGERQPDRFAGPRRSASSRWPAQIRRWALASIRYSLIFLIPFALTIAPWTIRNYVTYDRLILIDTLGPVNLWMAMSDSVNEGRGENEAKSILAAIPQEERQDFVGADIGRILREEPWRLVRNFWPHFIHIWKAQFIEDFFVKVSFFTRPLREIWPMGLLGDLLWLAFTPASLIALAARPREGGFRLLTFAWVAYSCLTVMLIHVEPRYLLPIWFLMGLYGAAALAWLWGWIALRRRDRRAAAAGSRAFLRSPWGGVGIALTLAMIVQIFSYRDYPQIIAQGVQREIHRAAAVAAYAVKDYPTAIAEYDAMLLAQPDFVDGRTELARIYLDLGRYDDGWAILADRPTHRADVIRGALARAQHEDDVARAYFEDAEQRAGENVQKLTLEWLNPPPTGSLTIGDGLDFGYLDGFSFGEDLPPQPDGSLVSYRWLQGNGVIALPLPAPLRAGSVLSLRMAGVTPGVTPLTVDVGGARVIIPVQGGQWRLYQVAVPDSLAGQSRIELRLHAPTFIPLQLNPQSTDARQLSLMVSQVSVE
ncbi:phospholipid carrier-dependent glycosyltransferase [Oscillochloris sp. ZM17-4]|uniref:phospholipid carrier-dependent glycosyltransferase n=1 Tax=Oscillochloris sp. ZM17-4 TaxID=2866714 RepID=UPI001C738EA4|nr:phospholipid carrier-dependent glycosyltransferase [Oscillochloris sp. ZM17-4]MBX0329287.1 phospholipid carrier-dependent glycosyltransferase [Oscillochloris sp. ZM17-4]